MRHDQWSSSTLTLGDSYSGTVSQRKIIMNGSSIRDYSGPGPRGGLGLGGPLVGSALSLKPIRSHVRIPYVAPCLWSVPHAYANCFYQPSIFAERGCTCSVQG